MSATRKQVVAEAYTWLRTPYVHQADVKGEGVDCAMLLIRIYSDLGLVPRFDPRPYSTHWYLHVDMEKPAKERELYLAGIERYAHRVHDPEPGDLLAYRVGRCVSHGAIYVGEGLAIHAYAETRRVELATREELARLRVFHYHSAWSVFP